ncbi:MAG: hypothetical protein ACREXU_20540 [Gammaproteobacteria bacterium]
MVKTRFAPSPTGPMYLGNVRDGLAAGFSLDRLGRAPARFDASLMARERVRERFAALIN